MKDKKFLYLLVLTLLTVAVLFSGQKGFAVQIFNSILAIAWAIIIIIIILFLLSRQDPPNVANKDVFVRIKGEKQIDFSLLKKIEGYKFYFVGGAKKSRILHFQGQGATGKNIKEFFAKLDVKDIEVL